MDALLHSARICLCASLLCFVLILHPISATAQQSGDTYFEQNCSSCHSIGAGFLAGPDLQDVTQRAKRRWLLECMRDPEPKIKSKDPYPLKLQAESQGMAMPAVLRYIESRSTGSHPQPEPTQSGDSQLGRALFTGAKQLSSSGAACMACHQAAGLPSVTPTQ